MNEADVRLEEDQVVVERALRVDGAVWPSLGDDAFDESASPHEYPQGYSMFRTTDDGTDFPAGQWSVIETWNPTGGNNLKQQNWNNGSDTIHYRVADNKNNWRDWGTYRRGDGAIWPSLRDDAFDESASPHEYPQGYSMFRTTDDGTDFPAGQWSVIETWNPTGGNNLKQQNWNNGSDTIHYRVADNKNNWRDWDVFHGGARMKLGGPGTDGHLYVTNDHALPSIELAGRSGFIGLGAPGSPGVLKFTDNDGSVTLHLDGQAGDISVGELGSLVETVRELEKRVKALEEGE